MSDNTMTLDEDVAVRLQKKVVRELGAELDERTFQPGDPRRSDCGGWAWSPPCGGCDRCIEMQFWYAVRDQLDMRIFRHRAKFWRHPLLFLAAFEDRFWGIS